MLSPLSPGAYPIRPIASNRTLWPWDKTRVFASIEKIGPLIVAHEAIAVGGFGAEVAATVAEHLHNALKAPVRRLGPLRALIGYAPPIEDTLRVTAAVVADAARALVSSS